MLQLTYPGVYTREVPSGVRTIAGAPTSVALFVGPTKLGPDGRPVRLLSYPDFERAFGGLSQASSLSYSVLHFFANGGGQAYVIRVPGAGAAKAGLRLKKAGDNAPGLTVTALGSGAAGNAIFLGIDAFDIAANPFTTDGTAKPRLFNLTIQDTLTGRVERFANLTTASDSARFAPKVVNDVDTGSKLVSISIDALNDPAPKTTGSVYGLPADLGALVMTNELRVRLSVARFDAAGAADAAASVAGEEIVVFPAGAARPASAAELVARIVRALNTHLRAMPGAAAKLGGAEIEGMALEQGRLMRLRLTDPAAEPTARIHDAVISLADIGGGATAANRLLAVLGITQLQTLPSRYRLGFPITGGEVTAATPGTDSTTGQPDSTEFRAAITALETPDPFFNLLCIPDAVRPSAADPKALHHANSAAIFAEGARVCAAKHAFLIVDPPPDVIDTGTAEAWKATKFTFQSSHAGAWFPNIRVDDPLEPGAIRAHPPSGAIAGVIARTDAQVGVWQAPAGTEAVVTGAYGPAIELPDAEHGLLNPLGLNVIRKFPIFGTVAFGARTIDGADAQSSDYKYIPVRRTASYILRSLSEGLRWAVLKPNGEALWGQLRLASTAFMHGLYRQGAFKGTSSREAYFVLCDASTTTPDDINAGIVNVVVGFAPLKPAEFVVISLRQIVQASN